MILFIVLFHWVGPTIEQNKTEVEMVRVGILALSSIWGKGFIMSPLIC